MRPTLLGLLIVATMALAACHKADNVPTIDFGAGDGISHRDANGMKNGSQDPTDWTSDVTWNEQETALFPELSTSLTSPQQPSLIAYTYAYPNPAKQAVWTLQANKSSMSYTVATVIVDGHYRIVKRFDHQSRIGGHMYALDYGQLGLSPNEAYRLYYVIFDNNGLLYKGHGDLLHSQ